MIRWLVRLLSRKMSTGSPFCKSVETGRRRADWSIKCWHTTRVQQWFHAQPGRGWATCPLTENAFLRILSGTTYPGSPGDLMTVRQLLARMCAFPGHQFWPDQPTLSDAARFPALPASRHLTDLYLLALAASHQGKLRTLDRRIDSLLLSDGAKSYFFIQS